ncbi:MAG: DUF86 domain-containing protein [Candidatus Bathyarchaeia archaeon]
MVFKKESILSRLKELDTVTQQLRSYGDVSLEDLKGNLSTRWAIERGLIAGANLIFDTADHILASKYRIYPETYEDSLRMMYQKGVISEALYKKLKGLGGFRNVLVHEYLSIDLEEVYKNKNYKESLQVFTEFAKEILESDVLKGD